MFVHVCVCVCVCERVRARWCFTHITLEMVNRVHGIMANMLLWTAPSPPFHNRPSIYNTAHPLRPDRQILASSGPDGSVAFARLLRKDAVLYRCDWRMYVKQQTLPRVDPTLTPPHSCTAHRLRRLGSGQSARPSVEHLKTRPIAERIISGLGKFRRGQYWPKLASTGANGQNTKDHPSQALCYNVKRRALCALRRLDIRPDCGALACEQRTGKTGCAARVLSQWFIENIEWMRRMTPRAPRTRLIATEMPRKCACLLGSGAETRIESPNFSPFFIFSSQTKNSKLNPARHG